MRELALLLTTWTAGCQCQDYHIAPTVSKVVQEGPIHDNRDAGPIPFPRATPVAPRGATIRPPGAVGEPGFPHDVVPHRGDPFEDGPDGPRGGGDDGVADHEVPTLPDDDCAPAVTLDTSDPASPFAPATLPPGACASDVVATWRSGTLFVDPADDDGAFGWLDVPRPGTWHLYAPPVSSGADPATAALVRVPTVERPGGRPVHTNCGTDWVVQPVGPVAAGTLVYLGTFALEAGPNPVNLRHACSLPEDGVCRGEQGGVAPATCDAATVTARLRLEGRQVCLVPVE